MRHAIIAVLLLAALAGTAVAGPFEDGKSAYKRFDFAEAAKWYRLVFPQYAGTQQQLPADGPGG